VDDVVTYLAKAIDAKETEGKTLEIGGPDVLSYVDMMRKYAAMLGKKVRILIIPFLTPRLSSYWIDLVTPVSASLARPLIDSLKHEATVRDDSVREIIPITPKSFEQAIEDATMERVARRTTPSARKERTSMAANSRALVFSLLVLAAIGSLYYIVGPAHDPSSPVNLTTLFLWYFGIAFALYFIRQGARLGAFVAGIVGWMTLCFWLLEARQVLLLTSGQPVAASLILAAIVAVCIEIAASHNVFHKLRPQ
jgi:hypothetical protein